MRMLITDLDNTLYDWVRFFALSFQAMMRPLSELLGVDEAELIDEFKHVHQRVGSSERPFAALELPAVRRRFPTQDRQVLARELDPAFHAFNHTRLETLRLYPGVEEALASLSSAGIRVVGYTEAAYVNAYQRLRILGVDRYFERVYAGQSDVTHPDPDRASDGSYRDERLRLLPPSDRKPDPRVLVDICRAEGAEPSEGVYVGDSLTRDVSMANAAGIASVWAKYGTEYDKDLWRFLVSISHWTDEEVARETRIRQDANLEPQLVIQSFAEIVPIVAGTSTRRATSGKTRPLPERVREWRKPLTSAPRREA